MPKNTVKGGPSFEPGHAAYVFPLGLPLVEEVEEEEPEAKPKPKARKTPAKASSTRKAPAKKVPAK